MENKKILLVPSGIRYISDWEDYDLGDFMYPHILDKKLPGCGYTEYALRCNHDVILCSPRKVLLQNKKDQHQDNVLYFRESISSDPGVDINLQRKSDGSINPLSRNFSNKVKESIKKSLSCEKKLEDRFEDFEELVQSLIIEVSEYLNKRGDNPKKILVTYDSFGLLKFVLDRIGKFEGFCVVVDEFQSIFTDSRFKGEVESEFITNLKKVTWVSFVSATPMMTEYLMMLDYFKDLPYYELDWKTEDPGRIKAPDLKVSKISSVTTKSLAIIETYKNGNFKKSYKENEDTGELDVIESREAVFYVNSVENIVSIIKKAKLTPEEVNILCSNTRENENRLRRKLGKEYIIGTIPLLGEPHKMFTFCTRTVYLGADFYSTNARSFILSDANIETLAVDISLDLPQILGRQRLKENPWRGVAEFYYSTQRDLLSKEDFDRYIQNKLNRSEEKIMFYKNNESVDKFREFALRGIDSDIDKYHYSEDYVSINRRKGRIPVPEINKLIMIAERRAFDIQQIDYKDRFSVLSSLFISNNQSKSESDQVIMFLEEFNRKTTFISKLRYLCENYKSISNDELLAVLDGIPLSMKQFFLNPGPDRCINLGCSPSKINEVLGKNINLSKNKDNISESLKLTFQEGKKYTIKFVKEELKRIFNESGLDDFRFTSEVLKRYAEVREVYIKDPVSNKRQRGYEILKYNE